MLSVTKKRRTREFEIKLTRQDFKADAHKKAKHQAYRNGDATKAPNQFYYVFPEGLVSADTVPVHAGILTVDEAGRIKCRRKAPKLHALPLNQDVVSRAYRSMMYRYWHIRRKL